MRSNFTGTIQKSYVYSIDNLGRVGIRHQNGGISPVPLAHWFIGGLQSGLHVGSAQHDQGMTLSWGGGDRPFAIVSATDFPEKLPLLAPGEPMLFGPNGSVLLTAPPSGTMQISWGGATIAVDPAGNITITAASGKNINFVTSGGGNLQGNGTNITVP